jgi:hypothetical protein
MAAADLPFSFFFFSMRRWASGQDLSTSGSSAVSYMLQGILLFEKSKYRVYSYIPADELELTKNESRHT